MKQYPILLIFLFLILSNHLASGQSVSIEKDPKLNPAYIRDYKEMITARTYLLYEGIGFTINPSQTDINVNYLPNIHTKVGVAAFYKWFGLGLAVRNPFYIRDSHEKGKSTIIDLRVNAYGRSVAAEISYQDYNGFYLSNSGQIIPGWKPGDVYYQRPDIEIEAFSILFYYLFNSRKHSIRAAYIQNEQQLKSSGALVLVPSFMYTKLHADSNLIPSVFSGGGDILPQENIIKGVFYNYGISIGYSYTFVFFKNFYLNMSLIPGAFLQASEYSSHAGSIKNHEMALLWLGRGALGFSNKKFFAGAGGVLGYNTTPLPIGNTNFHVDMNQLRIWAGMRFGIRK
ncbi:MAG: DUF4421 family protein [Bacteroidota bacterium]|nr:DUF4421 family protein [Bacteroidota bacterium]